MKTTRRTIIYIFLFATIAMLSPALSFAVDSVNVPVGATVLSKSNCKFTTATAAIALAIDPSSVGDITGNATLTLNCKGSAPSATYAITFNDGAYPAGVGYPRMLNPVPSATYLPYTFSVSPDSATVGRNVNTNVTATVTVKQADYSNAYVGSFTDTIIVTINP